MNEYQAGTFQLVNLPSWERVFDVEITSMVPKQAAGNLKYGINCYDSATGTGYLMYSEESAHERFSANPPNPNNADHFICVKYSSGQWKYDNGDSSYHTFTLRPTDVLIASINFVSDTITSLGGHICQLHGR